MLKVWNDLKLSYKIMVGVSAVLIVLLVASKFGFTFEQMPLPGTLSSAEKQLEKRQRSFKIMRKERRQQEKNLAELRVAARPFWSIEGRLPATEVQSQFEKLARSARVTIQNVGAPRVNKVSDHVRSVELTVRFRGSMREVARLLAELEKAEQPFAWKSANIRPDSVRDPKGVSMTGKIHALVLSPEAGRMLSEGWSSAGQQEASGS